MKKSNIRFSAETRESDGPDVSGIRRERSPDSSDEITPIRSAERSSSRSYDATLSGPIEHDAPGGLRTKDSATTATPEDPSESEAKPSQRWYHHLTEKYGSISLDNKGSVARDHLALERTFLAWLRTSLAFASIGIAITQLFRLNTSIASRSKQVRLEDLQRRQDGGGHLPLSPLLGHSLDADLVHEVCGYGHSEERLGGTFLDQMLTVNSTTFDEVAAAKLRHLGKPLGATFLAISIVVLFVGCHRYFESQHWIIRGKFPASRGSVALVTFIAAALIVASLVVVLVVAPTSFEK